MGKFGLPLPVMWWSFLLCALVLVSAQENSTFLEEEDDISYLHNLTFVEEDDIPYPQMTAEEQERFERNRAADDCALKAFAWEFAQKIQPNRSLAAVYNALALHSCGTPAPVEVVHPPRHQIPTSGHIFYVDPVRGNDALQGSVLEPFSTISKALEAARAAGPAQSAIVLRSGTHFLESTVVLGAEDSGLQILVYPGEQAIVSGGKRLDLQWQAWSPARHNLSCLKASIASTGVTDFTQLFVNGSREIRARHPNADPETHGAWSSPNGLISSAIHWFAPHHAGHAHEVDIKHPVRKGSFYNTWKMGYGGPASRFTPPRSYWAVRKPAGGEAKPYQVPSGLKFRTRDFPTLDWSNPTTGVVHAFHGQDWGNWQFRISKSSNPHKGVLHWTYGGFQEARGWASGNKWYVENIFELLDSPREWFLDTDSQTLYYCPGDSDPPTEVIVPQLETVFSIKGSQSNPVQNVSVIGVTFAHSTTTFLEAYEVPSGGDWSAHRGAMVVIDGSVNGLVQDCLFQAPGGNGLLLNNYNRGNTIQGNEFVRCGDSAIISLGTVEKNDGTHGNQPRHNYIIGNLMHEVGIFGKQAGGYYHALTAQVLLKHNIVFNGPRAGICFNDGFGGDNRVEGNLVFNVVRETSDHGPVNTWDRLPLISDVPGHKSVFPVVSEFTRNFLMSNFRSVWPLDHDDGSCYYRDSYNFLVYGGYKNYLGDHKTVEHNVYAFVDARSHTFPHHHRDQFYCIFYLTEGSSEVWRNNKCALYFGTDAMRVVYVDRKRNSAPLTAYNQYYVGKGTWLAKSLHKKRATFHQYQSLGKSKGSTVHSMPDVSVIIQWGRQALKGTLPEGDW